MKLQELFNNTPISERGDLSKITKGSIAFHGFLGAVKILNILGSVAEVAQVKGGKHARVQMSSLSADDVSEDTDLEEAMFPDSKVGDKLHAAKSYFKNKFDKGNAVSGASTVMGSAVVGAGITTAANMVPTVLLFAPAVAVVGSQMLALIATYGATLLSVKGINWLARKVFGTTEDALEFACLHLRAFKANKTEFSFQGKSYKVKLKTGTDVKDMEHKIEQLLIRYHIKHPLPDY